MTSRKAIVGIGAACLVLGFVAGALWARPATKPETETARASSVERARTPRPHSSGAPAKRRPDVERTQTGVDGLHEDTPARLRQIARIDCPIYLPC